MIALPFINTNTLFTWSLNPQNTTPPYSQNNYGILKQFLFFQQTTLVRWLPRERRGIFQWSQRRTVLRVCFILCYSISMWNTRHRERKTSGWIIWSWYTGTPGNERKLVILSREPAYWIFTCMHVARCNVADLDTKETATRLLWNGWI